ncbi:MAG: cell surface protein SprA [Tannerellaceae bacterium]|nr:cell surface protein SprA [Tannerellaceae bacterium]
MRRKILKYTLYIILLLFGVGLYSLNADFLAFTATLPEVELIEEFQVGDTIPPRYPVAKTFPEEYEDIVRQSPADLRDPENVKTTIEYDLKSGAYIIRTRIGEMEIGTPMTLTPEQYQNYQMQQSLRSYFRQKNEEEYQKEINKQFNIADMQFDLGPAERVFGPGGVRVRTQGSAQITMGLKNSTTKNPTLAERSRSRTYSNFDESVQLNVQANVGSKVDFGMNYNTESSFDFDSKRLKLSYTGDEDEIIKSLEAGNVSMTTSNSLINGGAALFGIKADLQFGKLRLNTLFAQQNSESRTVNSKGGVQAKSFEITADDYDENRHFFLAYHFRDNYDAWLKDPIYINSGVELQRIEVWITNKRGNYDQSRNIVAFSDLGENSKVSNSQFTLTGSSVPANRANTLYQTFSSDEDVRNISRVNQVLGGYNLEGGKDYEKVESARLLDASEYTINKQLGYISLKSQLQADEVLGVAYEYKYRNETYQVGEFTTDRIGDDESSLSTSLFVKLLKGTTMSPGMPFWDLMMKNVYSLGAYSVQKDKFRLNVMYQSDTVGTYLNYITEGNIANTILLRVMNLDNIDSNNNPNPDGFFDFIEGVTILAENGWVIFPVVEPFGSHLRSKIGNQAIAEKYVYQELYDSTLTIARQIAEKNKFILRGEYRASSASEIQLGATNVARGSVRVTAGGVELAENVDYIVDYTSGVVTIINEDIISSNSSISVNLENQSVYSMQRKTMVGLDMNYEVNPNLTLGATIMHLSEMPLTTKTTMGDEALKNTLWGLNLNYRGESQWLTNMVTKLPMLNLTQPSQITFNAEFAHLIAGHYENEYTGKYSYLDDFESSQSTIDLSNPYSWFLASTPYQDGKNGTKILFPEASLVNNIDYGKNRALLAWYYIDGIFTRKNSSQLPKHITKEDLSDPYVRAVTYDELYPNREQTYNESSTLQVLNMAYYPNERGPYNLDTENLNSDGSLANPETRWGGMMRKIDQTDFETANIEYIEFWMLDPFINDPTSLGGDLYINLGEISEDILKDEKKFFENGLPIDGDTTQVERTVWGYVPKQQSTVYAFDNTSGSRKYQDVGLDGLSNEAEFEFDTYKNYLDRLKQILPAETQQKMQEDPFSPLNDPAGDNFHHYRGSDYDRDEVDILTRYKRYNGTEGNSPDTSESTESYSTSARTLPDVEDINQDNTMNENEKYYEYRVSIRPQDLEVGQNYIVNIREANVTLADGSKTTQNWYQFKVPVKSYDGVVGNINDFKTIRFMRMYMTDFRESTVLRFGTLQLVRGEWRTYEQDLSQPNTIPAINGTLEVSSVNIEENGDRTPVNYVLPPGVTRMLDPSQPQLRQENEQALSLKITNLASQDARAIYKTTSYDLRQYKRLQLFTHAESFIDDVTQLRDNELSVFIRLGSDYRNNYYEYEIPLTLTPHNDKYNTYNIEHQRLVWPESNMFDFRFEVLTDLKLARNRIVRNGGSGVSYQTAYSEYDPDNTLNKVSIVGNPSLSDVRVMMIGVRNNSSNTKSAEIWINELRLTDFDEEGGWAVNANLNVALSDLGTVNVGGRHETAGFGGLDQSLNERRLEDYSQYNISTSLELGKFFPERANVSLPFYYAYSKEVYTPKYDPLNQDIKLKDALKEYDTKREKDSIKSLSLDKSIVKSIAFNNVRVNIKSKTPMPYDPANFSFGYSYSEMNNYNPETEYETTKDYRGNLAYSYTPYVTPYRPFKNIKNSNSTRYFRQLGLNYVPSNISFQTTMTRNYYEIQLRELENTTGENNIPVSFSQNFYWDRAFSLRWALTSNLIANFTSGTNARIEEPYVQVNKKLNPDEYQVWKDSVKQSIKDLGTPMAYDQTFSVTYSLPLQYFPALDWANAAVSYNASYNWDRGATTLSTDYEIGNTIKNQRLVNIQTGFNLLTLYNKNKFLKDVNQKYGGMNRRNEQKKPKRDVRLEKEVTLSLDSATVFRHNMLTKKLRVTARGADGKVYSVKFRPLNYSEIEILNKDSVTLQLTLVPGPPKTEEFWYKAAEYSSRFLMMIRRVNVQYGMTDGMMISGFRPEIGDIFGQQRSAVGLSPGLKFAFGSVRRSYLDEASDKGWLIKDEDNVTPAVINNAKTLTINTNLEPIPGLKIDLNANRVDTRSTDVYFMYDGMPEKIGGSFTMTTISLGSAFGGIGNASNGYASKSFDKFLENRDILAQRLENSYASTTYPNSGFLAGTSLAGEKYDPSVGNVDKNSADVLIPAFLAAYTGKDPNKISYTAFPSLSSLLPNWRITYEGLVKIPAINKYFKSLLLSHQYRSSYSVGSFTTFENWVSAGGDGLGFTKNALSEGTVPLPSSQYSIATVSITEGFTPLFGVDGTLLNNITMSTQYRTTRNLNLNISSYQLVESVSKEYVIGMGYKLTEFNKVLKMKATRDFSNDLNVRMDFSLRRTQALIRKIEENYTQATSGNIAKTIQITADYGLSRALTLQAFYDLQINTPLVSSTSYPTSNSSYGVTVRFSLAQ